eukprot:10312878-Alexandrium_andersonii.AAC.1
MKRERAPDARSAGPRHARGNICGMSAAGQRLRGSAASMPLRTPDRSVFRQVCWWARRAATPGACPARRPEV